MQTLDLASLELMPAWESPWLMQTLASDPEAEAILSQYVAGLSSAGFSPDLQGVWLGVGGYPIAQHREAQRLPAASLTKIATTLAALETWGVNHRFETLVGWRGTLSDGVLEGDLIIQGGSDPLFVWEEAIALGNALQQLGLQRVTGDLIVIGDFMMNFNTDPLASGALLQQAVNADRWSADVQRQYQTLPPGTPQPRLQIDGSVQLASPQTTVATASGWLLRHQSLPLTAILKAMNIYSNNVMSDRVAQILGGPTAVMQVATQVAGVQPEQIRLINGSGLGEDNQISAQAVVQMLQAIQSTLAAHQLTVADLFPVAGTDTGTLVDRQLPSHAALKTGSLAVVSALAGAFPTEKKGVVWFSIINYGAGLDELRYRQDQLLAALEQRWGKAQQIPPELKTTIRFNQAPYRLGDPQRNQTL
ncbi:MAG: D-alanyl-D-alanine carboxypeptidase [Leptolyngbya sp. SIO4C1]|nr:D-alanyl-D-alanine carboxypeptidase [Leptolyngbya sp. SIO4C1]